MHVAIVGIDGSGKSSFARVLALALKQAGKSVSLMEWFRDTKFRNIAIRFNVNEAMTPEVLAALHASSMLALFQQAEQEPADVYLWDRYIYSSYASCTVRGAARELMRSIVDLFPTPKLTILFLADPRTCFRRITEGRDSVRFYECGLDRLFRGRCQEAHRRFDAQEIPQKLIEEVFINTMTEWNIRLQEIIDPETTLIFEDFDLSNAQTEADRIIGLLFPEQRMECTLVTNVNPPDRIKISPEMADVIEFLFPRDDYVIFGSFAGYLLTESACSRDIDILVHTLEATLMFSDYFLHRGWHLVESGTTLVQEKNDGSVRVITLERNEMTIDICYYPALVDALFSSCIRVSFDGRLIRTISPEAFLITKLNHLTLDLPTDRTQRDREVIRLIRKEVNLDKLYTLLQSMGQKFWIQGRL